MSELLSILAVLISCAACLIVWRRSSSAPSQGLPPVLGELKKKLNFNSPPHVSQYRDEDALGPTNRPSKAPDFGTSSPHKPQLSFLTTRRKIWASIGIIGAAALACTIFIPVNNQIADHRAEFFAAFEGQVQSCFNGEHDNATTCNDLHSKRESIQSALSPLKKNPEPLSKKVELPFNVLGLKLLWEVSVLDTVNGPACLCDGLQEMDECRAIELIMQGQDYADLRSDLSIANMSTGWASDIHKKLLALLWQGNHIRTEPAPCPNCRAFAHQIGGNECDKIFVSEKGKRKFLESFDSAAFKRNRDRKSDASKMLSERFDSRIQQLWGASKWEAKQLLKDDKALISSNQLVTTTTALGDIQQEIPVWIPNFEWLDEALSNVEAHLREKTTQTNSTETKKTGTKNTGTKRTSKNKPQSENKTLREIPSCYTFQSPSRPWGNIFTKVGICEESSDIKLKVSFRREGKAIVVVKNSEGEIINHRLLDGPVSAMMRVGPQGFYNVFVITGKDFNQHRQVPGQQEDLKGFFLFPRVQEWEVYVDKHSPREVVTSSPHMKQSKLKAVFN